MLDEPQFFVEPAYGLGVIQGARRVALLHPSDAQLGQRLRGGGPVCPAEVGERVSQVARQVEGLTALGDGQCSGDSIRTVIEQRHDFFEWSQVKFAVGISHPVRAIERRAMPDGDHDVVQPVQLPRVVEHVPRRHDGKLHVVRDIQQCPRHGEIATHTVALNLHEKPLAPEDGLAVLREIAGSTEPLRLEGSRQQSVAARS